MTPIFEPPPLSDCAVGNALLSSLGLLDECDRRVANMRAVAEPGKAVPDRRPRDPSDSSVEAVYQSEDPLLGDAAPAHLRKTETPRDRLVAVLKAQGATDRAISDHLGITTACVANTCRQPHIRRLILKIISEEGRDAITGIINGVLADSIFKVIDIMNDDKSGPRTQLSAAALLMERAMGKTTQHVEVRSGKLDVPASELDSKLEELDARILHLQGTSKRN